MMRRTSSHISAELLAEAERAFAAPVIKVGFDRDTAIWAAAQHEMLNWLKHKANIPSDPTVSVEAPSPSQTASGAIVRMGS